MGGWEERGGSGLSVPEVDGVAAGDGETVFTA